MIALPVCADCGAVQYPPREACARCLSERLESRPVDAGGTLLARTRIHRSLEARFAERVPISMGTVRLDAGPVVFAFLDAACGGAGTRVSLREVDEGGRRLLAAGPGEERHS